METPIPSNHPSPKESNRWHKNCIYLVYAHDVASESSNSVYKIDLNSLDKARADKVIGDDDTPVKGPIRPILKIPYRGPYPQSMGCAQLGSKLYFVGGIRHYNTPPGFFPWKSSTDRYVFPKDFFPRSVYFLNIYDDFGGLKKLGSRLNAGKPDPCVFAANGKLYALACFPRLRLYINDTFQPLVDHVRQNQFECFDPSTNIWKVLDNPPLPNNQNITCWVACNVMKNRQQVVIFGHSFAKTLRLIYDLKQDKWISPPYDVPDKAATDCMFSFLEGPSDDTTHVYGMSSKVGPVKSKSGIVSLPKVTINFDVYPQDKELVKMSIPGIPRQHWLQIFVQPYNPGGFASTLFRYVGNRYFCYVHSERHIDQHYSVIIVLFKVLDNDEATDGIEIAHFEKYDFEARHENIGHLVGCFLVSPKKNKKMKKNKNVSDCGPVQSF